MTDQPIDRLYPTSLDELDVWAATHRTTSSEARSRFVQFVVLESFAAADLARALAFKGGNALRFGYRYPRSTFDLDFTAVGLADDVSSVRDIIDKAVREGSVEFGIKCKVSSVQRNPPRPESTLPTYRVKVAHATH